MKNISGLVLLLIISLTKSELSGEIPEVQVENDTSTNFTILEHLLSPPANVVGHISKAAALPEGCPSFENANFLTQTELFQRLVHPCRFDRITRPEPHDVNGTLRPVEVFARIYIYFLENLEAHDLQFKMHALLQLRFIDQRLVFKDVAPMRTSPILGENHLRDKLWVPHIFFANEKESGIVGTLEKDMLTSIEPDGTVIISTRIQATLYCGMDLRKFPFDQQQCATVIESWMYKGNDLMLHWENVQPITMGPHQHLTEYGLINSFVNESMFHADLSDLRHGAFAGNYSSLSFTVTLKRQMGFYLVDYFMPSMMIVAISWVSFWLQADQTAPRVMLGTTTMLTFITLSSAQDKTLPKVSYINASEIWSMGCTGFIFASLLEFAFSNTIWRRKKTVHLKKVNAKNIFKHTVARPINKPTNKQIAMVGTSLKPSSSTSSLKDLDRDKLSLSFKLENYLKVQGNEPIPTITTENVDEDSIVSIPIEGEENLSEDIHVLQTVTMTPQEISIWIDKRSRVFFPCAFLVFNLFYWTFVFI